MKKTFFFFFSFFFIILSCLVFCHQSQSLALAVSLPSATSTPIPISPTSDNSLAPNSVSIISPTPASASSMPSTSPTPLPDSIELSPSPTIADASPLETDLLTSGFEVSPATVDLTLLPYSTRMRNLSLRSYFPETTNFLIRVENYANSQIPSGSNSAADWISLSQSNLQLSLRETADFEVEIKVPASAAPGNYYAAVVISPTIASASVSNNSQNQNSADLTQTQSSQLELDQRVAVIFNIVVSGQGDYQAEIANFKTTNDSKTKTTIFRELPVFFNFKYKNSGTAIISSFGELNLYNWFGQKVYSLNVGQFTTIPNETYDRLISLEMRTPPAPGLYRGKLVLQNNFNQIETANTYFWFFPPGKTLILGFIALGALIIIFGGLIWIIYHGFYQKWSDQRARRQRFKKRRHH